MVSALIGVTLLPLYDMLSSSERGSKSSLNRVRATNYAADLLETLKAIPFAALPVTQENGELGWADNEVADHVLMPTGTDAEAVDLGTRISPVTGAVKDFQRFLQIAEISTRGSEGAWGSLKRILVTVRWPEVMNGRKRNSELRMVYLATPEGIGSQ
jgi:Tfp pilus assembly protein PilV